MLVSEIITRTKLFRSTTETDANLVKLLDLANREIYLDLNNLRQAFNDFDEHEDLTVADQLSYDMPSYCNYNDIKKVTVSTVDYSLVTNSSEWDVFRYVGMHDQQDECSGNVWGKYDTPNNKYFLLKDGLPIVTGDLRIKIFYYQKPVDITLTTQTPELEDKYIMLYIWKLAKYLCHRGHNPDIEAGNGYDAEYEMLLNKVKSDLHDKYMENPDRAMQKEDYI